MNIYFLNIPLMFNIPIMILYFNLIFCNKYLDDM